MWPTYRWDRRPRVANASPNVAGRLDRFVSLAKTNAPANSYNDCSHARRKNQDSNQSGGAPMNKALVKPKIFLTSGFSLYSLLSLYLGSNSFGKGYAVLPTSNIFMNKSD